MNTSLSIFARALATENLSFSFDADAETASFDVKNRHLVMPLWDVSETLQTMLVAHEIAHALWTPYEVSQRLFKEAEDEGYNGKILHRICNAIEDVRIEKLMKKKYPGTRRDFFLGYKEIVDKDMFKLSNVNWEKTDMISRLNAHFKWGVPGFLTIPFADQDEAGIADMIDRVETFEEAFALAKSLYNHPKMKSVMEKMEQNVPVGVDGEGEEMQSGVGEDISSGMKRKKGDECRVESFIISPHKNVDSCIISTDDVLKEFDSRLVGFNIDPIISTYREFVKQSDSFVRQLVAQFDRKKAADEIRRERPKQTGMLNLDRLHQFRTHDDIFLSKIVKQEGKNHGIVFLLDFSGSMGHTIGNCYLQVLQLVWFCEKAKIPFEVYAFTDIHNFVHREKQKQEKKEYAEKHGSTDPYFENFKPSYLPVPEVDRDNTVSIGNLTLIQMASSQDSPAKREKLLALLYGGIVTHTVTLPFSMGGTPTVEAINVISQKMENWIRSNNIQIPTLMVVTDGSPNGVTTNGGHSNMVVIPKVAVTVRNDIFGTVHHLNGEDYFGIELPNVIIGTMLDSMKQRMNLRVVGMFVSGKSLNEQTYRAFCMTRREMEEAWQKRMGNIDMDAPRAVAARKAYAEGALLVHPSVFPGFDAFFLTRTPKIVEDSDALGDTGTFTKIRNNFVKTMGKRGCSRVFLSKYVDIVAGQPLRDTNDPMFNLPIYRAP